MNNSRGQELIWELALVLVTVLWGWSFSAIHKALEFMSDSAFNAYRFLVAAIIIVPVLVLKKSKFSRSDIVGGGCAGLALYLAFFFQTKGLGLTSASNASFITGLAIVFTPIFAYILLKTVPKKQHILGATVATIGLALLTLQGLSIHVGDLLILLCAVSFASHIIILSRASKITNIINISFIQILIVGSFSLFQALASGEFSIPANRETINTIIVMATLGTALAFYIQTKAQVASSPNRIAIIIVLEPVFGGLFGYLLANDRLSMMNWGGAALILIAMLITEYNFKRG